MPRLDGGALRLRLLDLVDSKTERPLRFVDELPRLRLFRRRRGGSLRQFPAEAGERDRALDGGDPVLIVRQRVDLPGDPPRKAGVLQRPPAPASAQTRRRGPEGREVGRQRPPDRQGLPPGGNSSQSGVGVISGWVCAAEEVEIEITHADGTVLTQAAAYGTERADTQATPEGETICGDTDNGFGLLFNWSELGAGTHTVLALVDGEELGRAVVQVTVLDEAAPFVRELVGACVVEDFPSPGETVTLEWQQNRQNFVITGVD